MSLTTDAAGDGRGTHLSVFLILVKGSHDDKLNELIITCMTTEGKFAGHRV